MKRPADYFLSQADDARVTRVWSGLDARLTRARRRRPWLQASLALSAAALGVIVLAPRVGMLRPRALEQQTLQLADGSHVEHAADEPVEILAVTPERIELRMTRGRAHFEVTPNRKRSFLTHAGDYTIRVVGTAYTVDMGATALQVDVAHGEVEVRRNDTGALWRVRGGEHWRSGDPQLKAAGSRREGDVLGARSAQDPASSAPVVPADAESARPAPASSSGAGDSAGPPGGAYAERGRGTHERPDAEGSSAAMSPRAHAERARGVDQPSVADGSSAATVAPASSGPLARAASARGIRRSAELQRAPESSDSWRVELSQSRGDVSAQPAAVSSEGERAAERRSRGSGAHGGGEAAQLFQRAMAARGAGELRECEQLLAELLRRFPRDSRAGLAAFQLGRVRLDLGDARGALAALDRAARDLGTFEEQIEARRIEALERLGERAACQKARAAFLRTYPHGSFSEVVRQRCP